MLGIFSMAPVSFPPDFIWGSATAGYQIEGDNIHCGHWHREVLYHAKEPSGKACNFWNLWPQDFAMLSELGHRMFRMSVEWSRIEPEENRHDEEAVARYLAMFKELKKRGIKLCLTLHHFSQPQWFEEKGEFNDAENISCFLRHLEYLVPKVAPYVDLWNIFNEFNNGDSPSLYGRKTNCLIAHARAAQIIRAHSKAPVSTAHAMTCYQPLDSDDEFDVTRTRIRDWVVNRFFYHAVRTGEILFPYRDAVEVPELKGSCDFWAINYYTRHFVSARKAVSSRHECQRIRPIDRDFYLEEFYPQGLVDGLCQLKDLPVYITENGFCCDDDRLRILYLARHLQAVSEAMRKGCDVRGYLYWSLLDNYEWGSFVPRFGMVDVDFKTFERTPKPSAYFFRDILSRGGFDRDLVLKYLPEFKDWKIYPSKK